MNLAILPKKNLYASCVKTLLWAGIPYGDRCAGSEPSTHFKISSFFSKCIFFRIHADGTDMAFNNQSPFCLILSETATTVQDQLDLIRTQDTA